MEKIVENLLGVIKMMNAELETCVNKIDELEKRIAVLESSEEQRSTDE